MTPSIHKWFFSAGNIFKMRVFWIFAMVRSRAVVTLQFMAPCLSKSSGKIWIYCSVTKMSNPFSIYVFFCTFQTSEGLPWYVGMQFVQETKVSLRARFSWKKDFNSSVCAKIFKRILRRVSLFSLERENLKRRIKPSMQCIALQWV